MPTPPLRFVFVGGPRAWKPLGGHKAPAGEVFELRSIPGDVVACASTAEAAVRKLQSHLDRSFELHGTPRDWYEAAWQEVTDQDEAVFGAVIAHCSRHGEASERVDDLEVFVGHPDPRPLPGHGPRR